MKKFLSLLLVPVLLVSMFFLPCSAMGNDVLKSYLIETGPYYSKCLYFYKIFLSSQYVERADVCVTDSEDTVLKENEDYSIRRETVEEFGECYVLYILCQNTYYYLESGSLLDRDGKKNPKIPLTYNTVKNGCGVQFDSEIKSRNNMQAGQTTTVTFRTDSTVSLDGIILADNVRTYTLEWNEPGNHTLILTVNGLTIGKYDFLVRTEDQILEDRITELKSELREDTWGFFKSIPLALLMFPTAPLIIFGWIPSILAFGPIEYAGRFFNALSELRQLKAQR